MPAVAEAHQQKATPALVSKVDGRDLLVVADHRHEYAVVIIGIAGTKRAVTRQIAHQLGERFHRVEILVEAELHAFHRVIDRAPLDGQPNTVAGVEGDEEECSAEHA